MDTDELIVRARQNCCRLCLAPDSECVPIFDNYAADREPISIKILSCVKIKVSQADRLSSKICHLCLSFLNSWQSFKNRCIASQIKQQSWLEMAGKNGSGKANKKISITQNKSVSNNNNDNNNKMPIESSIKEELREEHENSLELDNNEEETMKVDLDPTEFLIQHDDEDDDDVNNSSMMLDNHDQTSASCNDGPPILTSLGLTHIAAVNPYSFLNTESTEQDDNQIDSVNDNKDENNDNFNQTSNNEQQTLENLPIKIPKTLSSCSICKLSFSTRANARRHERNIHGRIINSSLFGGHKTIIKKSQVTPEMMGIYDYTKPEKYRHLLTEQKLLFIRKNELFLKQYQTLTCKCCTKTHPTYKNFMAHMRKKYPTLARNLCFKCLKQFPTKAMFVSHLKKKCCINLYKLYLSDDSIPKDGIVQVSPEKMGAKDLLTNKVYVCKICSKKCRLKVEFRLHVNEQHSDTQKKDVPAGHCGYCGLNIEDPVERKRHYNNMECIVSLKCVTCEKEFDNHQSFIDHVYEAHLSHQQIIDNVLTNEDEIGDDDDDEMKDNLQRSFLSNNKSEQQHKDLIALRTEAQYHIDSRSPQNCKICGAHYNNYNNVLRHMEAKHPDQLPETYKCINCNVGFARMSMLREHMLEKHGKKVPKYTRRDTTTVLQIFACKICTENFPSIDKWITHQSVVHSHFICCQCNFQNKNIDEFKKHIEAHPSLMQSKISGNTNNINLNNSNTNKSNITQSTNETNESSRFDYIMKDVLEIRKRIRLQDEQNSDGNKTPSPSRKKMKLDTDLRECKVCHALFHTNLGLSNHMRTHYAQQRLNQTIAAAKVTKTPKIPKLPKSSQSAESKDTKKMHFGLTASDLLRRIRCRLCQKRFSTKKGYRKHMLNDHQINNVQFIKCTICNSDFTHEKGLKLHMLRTHDMLIEDVSSIDLKYECGECQSIFENSEQLNVHRNIAHFQMDDDEQSMNGGAESSVASVQSTQNNMELSNVWFQCRYCPANFDTNKKLAIHTNSHEEFDSNDYSCKDCGNVYSGRKSLWVHRYKKHPLLPEPSLCTLCNKTFFDKNMLDLHMKNYHMNRVDSSNIKTENLEENEDEDDENEEYDVNKSSINEIQDGNDSSLGDNQEVPGVRCTMCNLRFTDVETFTKHMSMHDMDFYTDNPLAAMFDTGPEDPNKFYERRRLAENGEYMCDICSKTFPMLTAFKVHRNWHFRSDGKQIPADPNTTWRGTQRKKKDPANSVKCQYCNSLFISNNNLRRHILELHKREITNGEAPKVFIEKYLECKRCEMKFRFKAEWISHKLEHVKNETIDKTLGWGCEICGKLVSRKERLIQHVKAHLKEDDQSQRKSNSNNGNSSSSSTSSRNHDRIKDEIEFENNSQDSNSMGSMSDKMNDEAGKEKDSNDKQEKEIVAHVTSDGPVMIKCDNEDEDNDNDNDHDSDRYDYEYDDHEREDEEEVANSSTEDEDGDNDGNGDNDNDNDGDDDGDGDGDDDTDEDEERRSDSEDSSNDSDDNDAVSSSSIKQRQLYSCDLCHVHFETSKELKSHVTSHFLNGPGSVILTETEKKSEDEDTINDENDDDDDNDNDDGDDDDNDDNDNGDDDRSQ